MLAGEAMGLIETDSAAMLSASLREGLGVRALATRFWTLQGNLCQTDRRRARHLIKAIVDQLRAAGEIDEHDDIAEAHRILQQAVRGA